jgi:hypothetical protein
MTETFTLVGPRVEVRYKIRTLTKTGVNGSVTFLDDVDLDEYRKRAQKMRESGDYKNVAVVRVRMETTEEVIH